MSSTRKARLAAKRDEVLRQLAIAEREHDGLPRFNPRDGVIDMMTGHLRYMQSLDRLAKLRLDLERLDVAISEP